MSKYIHSYGPSNDTKEYLFINLLIPSRAVFQTRSGNEIFVNQERNGNNFTFRITGLETPVIENHFSTVYDWANLEDIDVRNIVPSPSFLSFTRVLIVQLPRLRLRIIPKSTNCRIHCFGIFPNDLYASDNPTTSRISESE